jgi:hypothetical protein
MPSATAVKRLASDEHDTSEFCRPDPLSRPASSVAGERARPRPLFRVVDLLLRGHPHALASTTGRALEQMTGTPRSLRGPVGRRRAPSPRVQEWHKCSSRPKSSLAGRVPSPGRQAAGRWVPSLRMQEWHKCARPVECKRGSSDGITSSLRYADASRASCRQAAAYRRLEVFCCGLAQPPRGTDIYSIIYKG